MLYIYTDGSTKVCNKRGANNIGGYGYIVFDDEKRQIIDYYQEEVSNTTNNIMELTALNKVIKLYGVSSFTPQPNVYLDSSYAINCVTKWYLVWEDNGYINSKGKEVENQEIIKEAVAMLYSDCTLSINKVKGHTVNKKSFNLEDLDFYQAVKKYGNMFADLLATGESIEDMVSIFNNKYQEEGICH